MCIGPSAKDADLWILIWEELHRVHQEGILAEVDIVKAHRTKKEIQQMPLFVRFITQKNEKGEKLAKERAMPNGVFMAQARANTEQQEREVCAALQHAASFHCLVQEWKDCEELRGLCEQKGSQRSIEPSGVRPQTSISV